MNESTCIIVTSVIYFKDERLSYSLTRSLFTPEERLLQTKKTIASIREKIPNSVIYLYEQGIKDVGGELTNLVDVYKYIGNKKIVRIATDSAFKGLGECVGLSYIGNRIQKKHARIFKISGRYYLNENFSLSSWSTQGFTLRRFSNVMSTRLYSLNSSLFTFWKILLVTVMPLILINISLEKAMLVFLPKRYRNEIPVLGISGQVGINGEEISE